MPTGFIPWFGSRTSEQGRYTGYGPLLTDTSWLARPLNVGVFAGGIDGGTLIHGRLDQNAAFLGGIHYGWDYDHHWGIDRRIGYEQLQVVDRSGNAQPRAGNAVFGEFRLLYYPWGDMRWRPYLTGGLGLAELHFLDDRGDQFRRALFLASYGVGIKRLIGDRIAVAFEVTDILIPGSGELSTVNNLTFSGGVEYRFSLPKFRWPLKP